MQLLKFIHQNYKIKIDTCKLSVAWCSPFCSKIWSLTVWGCLASLRWPISIPRALEGVRCQGGAWYRGIHVDSSSHWCWQKSVTQSSVPPNIQSCCISLTPEIRGGGGGGVWLCSMLCIKPARLKTILFQLQGVDGWWAACSHRPLISSCTHSCNSRVTHSSFYTSNLLLLLTLDAEIGNNRSYTTQPC